MTGNEFRAFREKHNLTQTAFAEALGITRITVYKNENRGDQPIASSQLYTRALRDLEKELAEKAETEAAE